MRVLIRNAETGLFFRDGPGWTAARMEARDFSHTTEAIEFAIETGLRNVEIVFSFADPRYDLRLPCRS
jgi:hypothetical protein